MKLYEKAARYFLGLWFGICAFDGWAFLFFDLHVFGEPQGLFFTSLMATTYFWVFLKILQTVGAFSLLFNYKPALGLVIVTPIATVLALFYFFEILRFVPFGILILVSIAILIRAYSESYMPLLKSYK